MRRAAAGCIIPWWFPTTNKSWQWRTCSALLCAMEILVGIFLICDGTFFGQFAQASRATIVGIALAFVGTIGVVGSTLARRTLLNFHLALILGCLFLSWDLVAVVNREGLVDCSLAALYAKLDRAEMVHNAISRAGEGFNTVSMRLEALEGAIDDGLARAHAFQNRPIDLSASDEALIHGHDEKEDLAVLLGNSLDVDDAAASGDSNIFDDVNYLRTGSQDLVRRTFEVTDASFVKGRLAKLDHLVQEAKQALAASRKLQRGNALHPDEKGGARDSMRQNYLSHLPDRHAEEVIDAVANRLATAENIATPIIQRIERLQERSSNHKDSFVAQAFEEITPHEYERLLNALDMAYSAFEKGHEDVGVEVTSSVAVRQEMTTPTWLKQLKGELPIFHTAFQRLKTHAYASMPIEDIKTVREMWKERWSDAMKDVSQSIQKVKSGMPRSAAKDGINVEADLPSHCRMDLQQRKFLGRLATAVAGLTMAAGYFVTATAFMLPKVNVD